MTRRRVEQVAGYVAEVPIIVASFTLAFLLFITWTEPVEQPAQPYGVQQP